jgi:plastocyanin
MNDSFRRRVFTPLLMPLTILGLLLLFGMSLSRVLLAVPEAISVAVAVGVASYVLLMAFVVERNRSITAPAVAAGLVLGLLGVVGAGALAASAGVRELHHEGDAAGGAEGEGGSNAVEIGPDALVWTTESTDLVFTDAPDQATAGTVTIALVNPTGVAHNVVFEDFQGDQPLAEATSGEDATEVEVPPGEYVYYCSVPGHRPAGMEGTITFE